MKAFLRWWLLFCLLGAGAIGLEQFEMFKQLYDADVSKLSFLILSMFLILTCYVGTLTYRGWKGKIIKETQINTCWFFAETLPTLGMIGTVIGFLIMLGMAFQNLDVTQVASVQEAIRLMALGMSTALVTTLVGMVSGLLLKLQLVNFENGQA